MRFHSYHGANIQLLHDGTVAHRRSSFANSIAFGEKPLKPYELFLLEITNNENGWSGHLRVGITYLNPEHRPRLPLYALPDLNASGLAWVFAITRIRQRVQQQQNSAILPDNTLLPSNNDAQLPSNRNNAILNRHSFLSDEDSLSSDSTSSDDDSSAVERSIDHVTRQLDRLNGNVGDERQNYFPRFSTGTDNHLYVTDNPLSSERLPTDEGSRIGVYYRISPDNRSAKMHFVINGVDQGPSSVTIPYNGQPLFPVIDVYGTTKQVQIVQPVHSVNPLQHLSAYCILKYMENTSIDDLPLPRKMKSYLQYVEKYYYVDRNSNNSNVFPFF